MRPGRSTAGIKVADRAFLASDNAVFSIVGNTGAGVFSMTDASNGTVTGTAEGDKFSYHCEIGGVAVGTDVPWTVGGTGAEKIGGFAAESHDAA